MIIIHLIYLTLLSAEYEYINELNFCLPTDNKVLFHAWYLVSYIFPAAVAVSLNGFIMRYLGNYTYFGWLLLVLHGGNQNPPAPV